MLKSAITTPISDKYNPNPILFEDPALDTAVKEAIQQLKHSSNGQVSTAFVYADKKGEFRTTEHAGASCYGATPGIHPFNQRVYTSKKGYEVINSPALAFIDYTIKSHKLQSHLSPNDPLLRWKSLPIYVQKYMNWWVKESPYNKAFISKDPRWIVENAAVYDVSYSPQYLFAAGMGLRNIRETPERIKFFNAMKKQITPELAIFMANSYYIFKDQSIKILEKWNKPLSTSLSNVSSVFVPRSDVTAFRAFANRDLTHEKPLKKMSEFCSYVGFHLPWNGLSNVTECTPWVWPDGIHLKGAYYYDLAGARQPEQVFDLENLDQWLASFVALNKLEDVIDVKTKKCLYHTR